MVATKSVKLIYSQRSVLFLTRDSILVKMPTYLSEYNQSDVNVASNLFVFDTQSEALQATRSANIGQTVLNPISIM